jgi:hypothetical protein
MRRMPNIVHRNVVVYEKNVLEKAGIGNFFLADINQEGRIENIYNLKH